MEVSIRDVHLCGMCVCVCVCVRVRVHIMC